MSSCPYCDVENIEGVDVCEECGQPLTDMHLSTPGTAVEQGLLKDRIGSLNPKKPFTVAPSARVRDVLVKMATLGEKGIGCVIVSEGDQVVGIFSERDALRKINVDITTLGDRPISEFMTPNPQMLEAGAKIAFAVQRMDLGGYRHVPILDESGAVSGIISVRDILRYVTEKMGSM